MEYVALGNTNMLVSRIAFGAYGLQNLQSDDKAISLVRLAYEKGINFFDTTRSKPESEKRLGLAIQSMKREDFVITTKTISDNPKQIASDIEESLFCLQTDYVDLYQIENFSFVPQVKSTDGIFSALEKAKKAGKIRHIGYTTDSYELALEAIDTGLFETIQFPFNILLPDSCHNIPALCEKKDIGFMAMRPLCGGIVTNIPLAYGFIRQFENVVPLWGIRTEEELNQILYFEAHPPVVDEQFFKEVKEVRERFS